MDVDRFLRELPGLFDDYPASEHPRDRRFARVLADVPGLATENCLALLNLAAACLEPGEAYVEAGSYRGTSLISAGLGTCAPLVGIDRFSMEGSSRELLETNLAAAGLAATIVEADVLEALGGNALAGIRAGVFYYDADHSYAAVLEALRAVRPHLAPRALVVVDDSDWERVARAVRDFLAGEPRARLVLDLKGASHGQPQWWEGVQALELRARVGDA
jgi:predicted O-methyltransferase YrrM